MAGFVIFVSMVVAMLMLGAALTWGIAGNMRQGDAVRRTLAQRLEALRLGRALTVFGVDTQVYLHVQRIVDIEAQMRSCNDCNQLQRCDNSLEQGTVSGFADFCPNEGELSKLRAAVLVEQPHE